MNSRDILPILMPDFIKDFSFADVAESAKEIFNYEDHKDIMALQDEEKQVILIFFILMKKSDVIFKFLNVINEPYSWLANKIMNYHEIINEKQFNTYKNALNVFRFNFSKHVNFNVHRLDYYCTIRKHLLDLKPNNYLIISGDIGYGKKWLAVDACSDYSVLESFNFKLYWLDVHDCDKKERDLEKLQRLLILLNDTTTTETAGDYEGIDNKILKLQQEIRAIFKKEEYKNCLLILSNVRNLKTIQTFKLGCKILIITRLKDFSSHIESSLMKTVHIDEGFTKSEYVELVEKITETKRETFPINSIDLYDNTKGHPFMLNIISQNIKVSGWDLWIEKSQNFYIDDKKFSNMIELSLKVLNSDELDLYKTLAIFYHSIKIPIKILARLWKKTTNDAIEIVKKFDKFSLVNIDYFIDKSMACTTHFLYYSYLQKYENIRTQELHHELIKSYKIEDALNNRKECDLTKLPNDEYFYYYIGFHLQKAGLTELFSKLYLDFGFLEQKLRAAGLANTIGDLKYYRKEITGGDSSKEKLVNSLLEFLPNIEEMIFRSNDTNLIQYALMGDGLVHENALEQAKQFPDNIWFFDGESSYASSYRNNGNLNDDKKNSIINKISSRGHFHRRRQMISLPGEPQLLKLIDPDTCLISLKDHTMLLTDLSLGYNIESTKFVGHNSDIIAVDLFAQNYLISLDRSGEIRIWSIADERRCCVTRKQSTRQKLQHINLANNPIKQRRHMQLINNKSIKCFQIDEISEKPKIILILVLENGDIMHYKWREKEMIFEKKSMTILETKLKNIQNIIKINNSYFVIDTKGILNAFDGYDSSKRKLLIENEKNNYQWPDNLNAAKTIHYFYEGISLNFIFVFEMKIIQVNFPNENHTTLKLDIIYNCPDNRSAITCSCLSDNKRYLIIGTKQGIIVFDTIEKSEVLRNSMSESIVCVDIHSLDDDIYKYIIVSGSKERKVLNIFGLKMTNNQSITWANSIGTLGKETNLNPQFEPNTWLMGKNLFDVNFGDVNSSIVAIDSKNRIHQMTIENKNWSLIVPQYKITTISTSKSNTEDFFYGCENGKIFDSNENELKIDIFKESITFLKLVNNLLIASSSDTNDCVIYCLKDKIIKFNNKFDISNIHMLFEKYLVMWNERCEKLILDINDGFKEVNVYPENVRQISENELLGGSDFKSNLFIIGTNLSKIYGYKYFLNDNKLIVRSPLTHNREDEDCKEITCIANSSDLNYCAVGLENGIIEIYEVDLKFKLIGTLKSHKSQIYEMKFSPWPDNNSLILASCSEQLCFWEVNYLIKNSSCDINSNFQKNKQRRSSRFNSSSNYNNINETDCQTAAISQISLSLNTCHDNNSTKPISTNSLNGNLNTWFDKEGSSKNPVLLSCIKFAGSKAEKFYANKDFTRFITIDDEGEYYFLIPANTLIAKTATINKYNYNNNYNDDNKINPIQTYTNYSQNGNNNDTIINKQNLKHSQLINNNVDNVII